MVTLDFGIKRFGLEAFIWLCPCLCCLGLESKRRLVFPPPPFKCHWYDGQSWLLRRRLIPTSPFMLLLVLSFRLLFGFPVCSKHKCPHVPWNFMRIHLNIQLIQKLKYDLSQINLKNWNISKCWMLISISCFSDMLCLSITTRGQKCITKESPVIHRRTMQCNTLLSKLTERLKSNY